MMKKSIFISNNHRKRIVPLILCLSMICAGQNLIFHSEQIEIKINKDYCILTGSYQLRNDSDSEIIKNLSYPFPVQPSLPFPDSISITDNSGNFVDYIRQPTSILFPVRIPAKSTCNYKIVYNQSTPHHFFEYILETTMQWHFPIALAKFDIVISNDVKILEIQPAGFQLIQKEPEYIYRLFRENFRSDQNLIIKWSQL